MSYDKKVDDLCKAMLLDAFENPVKVEPTLVREMDVSDCPDLDTSKDMFTFETTEDYLQDAYHEILMGELNAFAS